MEAADAGHIEMDDTRQFVTGVACKLAGGKWKGGHDISGHVFLLVLGSMFLFEEVLHVVLKSSKNKEERSIVMNDGAVKSAEVEAQVEAGASTSENWTLGSKITLGIGALSVYMLLMTAAYFHTWFEKVCGPKRFYSHDKLTLRSSQDYWWHSVASSLCTSCRELSQRCET